MKMLSMPKIKTQITFILLTLFTVTACEQQEQKGQPLPKLVKAIKVADQSGLLERSFPGKAYASREVNLSFRVSGPLITFPVNVGDHVKAGDILARIDANDFQTRVNTVEGELQTAKARAELAQKEYVRGQQIDAKGGGLISKSELDKRQGEHNIASAQVNALTSSLKLATDQLNYTYLKAPFDGVVVATYVENFEDVVAKTPVLRLLDANKIEIIVDVPESLIGYSAYIESMKVRFAALPDIDIPARIKEIGREASQATRTFPVTLIMDQPEGAEILPGMVATATVISRPPSQASEVGINIPATAILSGADGKTTQVYIVDQASMTLSLRKVTLSRLSNSGVLVKDGLKQGEWLVTAGVHSVAAGQKVRILNAKDGGSK